MLYSYTMVTQTEFLYSNPEDGGLLSNSVQEVDVSIITRIVIRCHGKKKEKND